MTANSRASAAGAFPVEKPIKYGPARSVLMTGIGDKLSLISDRFASLAAPFRPRSSADMSLHSGKCPWFRPSGAGNPTMCNVALRASPNCQSPHGLRRLP